MGPPWTPSASAGRGLQFFHPSSTLSLNEVFRQRSGFNGCSRSRSQCKRSEWSHITFFKELERMKDVLHQPFHCLKLKWRRRVEPSIPMIQSLLSRSSLISSLPSLCTAAAAEGLDFALTTFDSDHVDRGPWATVGRDHKRTRFNPYLYVCTRSMVYKKLFITNNYSRCCEILHTTG